MVRVDWKAVAEEYITGEISMRSLAVKYAVPRSTLRSRAYREGWIEKREAFHGACAPEAARNDDAAAACEEAVRGGDPAAVCEETDLEDDAAAALGKNAALEKDTAHEEILRVTDMLVRRAEELLNTPEDIGVRELGELMRAIKNAKEIRMLRPELDEREQLLRLRTLEEKSAQADARSLRIEFSPEAEEAAQ